METLISKFKHTIDFEKLKTIENVKDEFIRFLSQNTHTSDVNDYLKDVLDYFRRI